MANPNHRVVVNPGSLPFAGYPIQITTTTPFNVNYAATGIGDRAFGNTGYRIWDTALLPLTGDVLVTPLTPLIFPLTTSFLSPSFFDSVFVLTANNQRTIQAFSNSPDNVAGYTSSYFVEETIVYAANIYNINFFAAPNNRHYTFGGATQRINGGDDTLFIYFDKPTPTSINMQVTVDYLNGSGISRVPVKIYNIVVPANTLTYAAALNIESDTSLALGSFTFYTTDGYYKIKITTPTVGYTSALPFYHWGVNN